MILGQSPGFTAVMVGLLDLAAVEQPMRAHCRVDQQGAQAMLLGQMSGVVAAQGAADQQRPAQFGDGRLQLRDGLARMMVQGRHPQMLGDAALFGDPQQLAGLGRGRRAVEAVDIKDAGHGEGRLQAGAAGCKPLTGMGWCGSLLLPLPFTGEGWGEGGGGQLPLPQVGEGSSRDPR
ncbi:hypothetical protein D3C84_913520 [compost metagenome]